MNTKVKILKNGFDIEKAELYDIENVESKIYEKYVLFVADKLLNDYSNLLPSKQTYQTEIEQYRNYLYQFSNDEIDIDDLKINELLLEIKNWLLSENPEIIVKIGKGTICINSGIIFEITQNFVDAWFIPEFLSWVDDISIQIEIEDCFGGIFRKQVLENLVSCGIDVEEKKEGHQNVFRKTSIYYKETEVIAAEVFADGVEAEIEIDKSLVDGLTFICKCEDEQKEISVHFPFFLQGDVIHLKVSNSAGVAVLFITYVRFDLTVKKPIWGTS